MDPLEIVKRLYDTGHFWNPAKPESNNVSPADLDTLTLDDKEAKQAVESFQEMDENVSILALLYHSRRLEPDGEMGPATESVLQFNRCPMPDHPPPPNATFHYDDPGLQAAVETMQEFAKMAAATGSGSWPRQGCDPQHQGLHSIRVLINPAEATTAVRAYLSDALAACHIAYADIGLHVRYVTSGACEIQKRIMNIPGSVIGYNYFPTPNSCRQITGQLDRSYNPGVRYFAALELHETGHGVGLEHTKGGIMNPSILNPPWPLTWRNTPSFNRLKQYFGGEPIIPVTPVPVEHPPFEGDLFAETFPGGIAIRGEPELVLPSSQPAGRYRYIAVPAAAGKYKLIPKPNA